MHPIRAIEIKLSQGAKPGLGGVLPAAKVTAEIAAIRGVPQGQSVISPASHRAFRNVDEMLDFVEDLADASGLPVGIKSAVGQTGVWRELADRMAAEKRGVDITITPTSAASGSATNLAAASGSGQTGTVSTALASPFVVRATDGFGNGVSGVPVTWAVAGGGGSLGGVTTITDATGFAQATLTLGATPGANTVTATNAGLSGSPVTFSATGSVPASANLNRWSNAVSGAWSTAANWSTGSVPTASDSVVIDQPGFYTITMDVNAIVWNLMLGGASGTQTLTGTGRTLTLNGAGVVGANGVVSLNTSTINGTGSLTNQGTATITGGSLSLGLATPGLLVIRQSVTMSGSLSTPGTLRVQGAAGFNTSLTVANGWTNTGRIELTDVAGLGSTLTVSGGTLVNAPSGVIDVQAGGGGSRTLAAALDNQGTVTVSRFLSLGAPNATHTNSGTINLIGGPLSLGQSGTGSFTNTGTGVVFMSQNWIVSGGTLNLTGGSVSAGGLLSVSSATLNYVPAALPARMSLNGGTVTGGLTIPSGQTLQLETSNFASAVTAQGTLVTQQAVTIGGALLTPGTLRVNAPSGFTTTLTVTNGWTNTGTVELTDAAGNTSQLTVTNGTLTNASTGAINVLAGSGSRTITAALVDNSGTMTINRSLSLNGALNQQNLSVATVASTQSIVITGALTLFSGSTTTVNGTLSHGGCTAQGGSIFSGLSCP